MEYNSAIDSDLHPSVKVLHILQEAGVQSLPKQREVLVAVIPETDDELVSFLPRNCNIQSAKNKLYGFRRFLQSSCLVDQFGEDNHSREKWRDWVGRELSEEEFATFKLLYEAENQLRGNNIGAIIGNMGYMANIFMKGGLQAEYTYIKEGTDNIFDRFNGKLPDGNQGRQYKEMNMHEKIEIVRALEDEIVNLLRYIFGQKVPYQKINIT